jgi:hypothetical protein
MPCLICGESATVRSHIIPKALIHDLKEGEKHVISGSRHRTGIRSSQAGSFDSNILCSKHENFTAPLDKYGVKFIRKSELIFRTSSSINAYEVPNDHPNLLHRFALAVVWREVHSINGIQSRLSLGRYEESVRAAVFGLEPLGWPLWVQRTRFTLGQKPPINFAVHPYRIRLAGRNAWTFTALGHGFFLISDNQGIPATYDFVRADMANPALVLVGHEQDFRTVGTLKSILANMLRRDRGPER